MDRHLTLFLDPALVRSYVVDAPRKVPGLNDLHMMTTLLLEERAPGPAHILVVGAGGGLEIRAMAGVRPDWRFTGVDPSPAMLDIARQTTADVAERTDLRLGTAQDAPLGPFDGAVCLLTLHFLDRRERLQTLQGIRSRLKPGAVFVAAHHVSVGGEAEVWLHRSAVFARHLGASAPPAASSAKAMADRLPLLSPKDEEECFREGGFQTPALFYAALSFRGWVMIAAAS
ncbi:MAG: class I SAM-dependent methyltransferase [Pseudomonadota bacterium]